MPKFCVFLLHYSCNMILIYLKFREAVLSRISTFCWRNSANFSRRMQLPNQKNFFCYWKLRNHWFLTRLWAHTKLLPHVRYVKFLFMLCIENKIQIISNPRYVVILLYLYFRFTSHLTSSKLKRMNFLAWSSS